MPNEETPATEDRRPTMVNNWIAFEDGAAFRSGFECPFYGDAHTPGEIPDGFGPYQILNGLAGQEGYGIARQVLVLRCGQYVDWDSVSLSETNDESYHGGSLPDEVAALMSVSIGVRLKAGPVNRYFFPGSDPRGIPFGHGGGAPALLTAGQRPIVPEALGTHELGDGRLIKKLPALLPKDMVALVRSSRYFQDGLWLAESDPALAWILFVSAIETAANRWREADEVPEAKLRQSKPELVEYLEATGGPELIARVASEFVPYMGSTKKFIDFLLEFRPPPPSVRPVPPYQLSWSNGTYKRAMSKIYDYRSRALHGGKPFPMPMCLPPEDWASTGVPHEIIGHSIGTVGSAWAVADLPMYLHTFVYLVRGSLLKWWERMTELAEAGAAEAGAAEA